MDGVGVGDVALGEDAGLADDVEAVAAVDEGGELAAEAAEGDGEAAVGREARREVVGEVPGGADKEEETAGAEDAGGFEEGAAGVVEVLEGVGGEDGVEAPGGDREGLAVGAKADAGAAELAGHHETGGGDVGADVAAAFGEPEGVLAGAAAEVEEAGAGLEVGEEEGALGGGLGVGGGGLLVVGAVGVPEGG